MCTVHCKCKPKRLFTAAEVAVILLQIGSKAEENGTWESTCKDYRSLIRRKVEELSD